MDRLVLWLRRHSPGTVVRLRGYWEWVAGLFGILPISATLSVRVFRPDGHIEDLGVVSTHVVSTAFVNALVDTLQASVAAFSTYKYHDSGTGTTTEAAADTTLETPCAEARDTGTQEEGTTSNIYKSVATHTYAGTFSITEHILANASSNGTIMDRSVFTAIVVTPGYKIEYTYQLTCTAGG